ncbi:MAG: VCBS repeat-containing protein, partial [Acidobacteria bacterium]|nr:VCBS repeat-containing protein [Acidobacteriota bacterium]
MTRSFLLLILCALAAGAKDPVFLIHQIGNDRSEGVTVFDMDRDGRLDVTSGA